MEIKSVIGAACTYLAVISFDVSAALIANGDFTTDTATGMDWLDPSFTLGMSVEAALAVYGVEDGPKGPQIWQVAT